MNLGPTPTGVKTPEPTLVLHVETETEKPTLSVLLVPVTSHVQETVATPAPHVQNTLPPETPAKVKPSTPKSIVEMYLTKHLTRMPPGLKTTTSPFINDKDWEGR